MNITAGVKITTQIYICIKKLNLKKCSYQPVKSEVTFLMCQALGK